MPSFDQRMKSWAALHHGPGSAGIARHLAPFRCRQTIAPFRCRQTIAPIVRRRSRGGVLPLGRAASTSGSSAAHRSSVNVTRPSHQRTERRQMATALKP